MNPFLNLFADRPVFNASPDNYPNTAWNGLSTLYDENRKYYDGLVLNEMVGDKLKYPAQINLVRPAVAAHVALLLGQFEENIVKFGIRKSLGVEDSVAKNITEVMNKLWSLNNGDQKMAEQAINMMVFGGFFFAIKWLPKKKFPIAYIPVDPRNIRPVWDGDDYDRLVSVDVITQVSKVKTEARLGVFGRGGLEETASVHEYWNEQEYYVEVDGKIATWPDGTPMKGKNPFICPVTERPIVPFVYAPRVRSGDFFGESLVPSISGAQNEFNGLLSDLSTGITDAMRQKVWVRNRDKGAQDLNLNSNSVVNLGSQRSDHPNPPELGRLEGANVQASVTEYVTNQFLSIIRMAHSMPDVGYGDTDSSVRSAITLNYMMWPATSKGREYRLNASVALKDLCYKAAVMAYTKKELQSDFTVSDKDIEAILLAHRTQFPPMLPQDRNEIVNEVVQRLGVKAISKLSAIIKLDGDDVAEDEVKAIEEDVKAEQERMMAQQEHTASLQASTQDRNGSKNKPKNTSNSAQAQGGRAKFGGK